VFKYNFIKNKFFWMGLLQPFLIAIYPVVRTAYSSLGIVCLSEFLIVFTLFFLSVSTVYVLFDLGFKDWNKSSFCLSICLFFFYGFHRFSNTYLIPIARFTEENFIKFRVRYFFVLAILLLVWGFWRISKLEKVSYVFTRFLILPLLVFYSYCGLSSCFYVFALNREINKWCFENSVFYDEHFTKLAIPKNKNNLPDIYHIILDGYASEKFISQNCDWNVSWFTKRLKEKGFLVAEKSFSNYANTYSSFSSFLNVSHHGSIPVDVADGLFIYKIQKNNLLHFLSSLGYKYIHISGDSLATCLPFEGGKQSFYIKNYFKNSWYRLTRTCGFLSCVLGCWSLCNYVWLDYEFKRHAQSIFRCFHQLNEAINITGPKYVFAHIMAPHDPYVFDKDGKFIGVEEEGHEYSGQVEFISKKTDEILNQILDNSGKKPIVILHGDHGISCGQMFIRESINNIVGLPGQIRQTFPILNAYYLPEKLDKEIIYDSISPVNSFRVILNKYFGANFKLLKDSSFIGPDLSDRFVCVDDFRD